MLWSTFSLEINIILIEKTTFRSQPAHTILFLIWEGGDTTKIPANLFLEEKKSCTVNGMKKVLCEIVKENSYNAFSHKKLRQTNCPHPSKIEESIP